MRNEKLEIMEAQVKTNPTRIRVPKYGNGLMLLMEYSSRKSYSDMPLLGVVTDADEYFDIQVRMSKVAAQSIKKYINANL